MKHVKLYENFGEELITIPEKYDALIGALGDVLTPKVLLDEWNSTWSGDYKILDYKDGIFYGEEGEKLSPEDIFIQLDDFYRDID